ncbi:MAG: exodeoxyribonuclease V subunit gamma [Fibrobacterales bacterium]|nr:exodeoxyribonuclease V subunit gamma [Fibrobacterales bacterium]
MPFHVYYSDRIEDLAARLKADLGNRKQADPFIFPKIVTPNPNVGKYLRIEVFSKVPEFCAGVDYPMLRGFLVEQMKASLPGKVELLPDRAYAVAIADNLLNPRKEDEEALKPFREYVFGDAKPTDALDQRQARMLWQLSDKLAGLLDDYEIHRPDVVERWLNDGSIADKGNKPEKGSSEAGEAVLAKRLWAKDGRFGDASEKKSMRQIYEMVKGREPADGDEIYLFGHSTLSPLQAKIVLWLARKRKVFFYHNNPCLEYWGDIESDRKNKSDWTRKSADDWMKKWNSGPENELLCGFGAAGRATVALLQDCSETDGFEMEPVEDEKRPAPNTVLGRVQESIRHRTSDLERKPQDASLQIVGTPGIRREVEMVYNSIVGSVWKPEGSGKRPWPDCLFSDIAVLVPDMATYRPVIESVFDARGEVPYGLIDTTASEESSYLAGFLALMELGRRGFSRQTLFGLLGNVCVQSKQRFDHGHFLEWLDLTGDELHAFDGFDKKDDDDFFNWKWALERLRLARVADSLKMPGSPNEEMPLVPGGGESAMRFSALAELLHRELVAALGNDGTKRLPCVGPESEKRENWASRLAFLADAFLAPPDGDPLETHVQNEVKKVLRSLADLQGSWNVEIAAAAVEHFVGGLPCRKGGYLTHGVTIAGMMPMRPVPFRQIYVLGLGEGGFPGRESGTTLDVRGLPGMDRGLTDISAPNMNRYVFLETLMSVRDRLVLSYPNLDIEKDAELFPCGPVLELEKFVGEHVLSADADGKPVPFAEFKGYPLLERGEMDGASKRPDKTVPVERIVWKHDDPDAGILPSYSAVAREIARKMEALRKLDALGKQKEKDEKTLRKLKALREQTAQDENPFAAEPNSPESEWKAEFTSKELAEFVKNPTRGVMKGLLGVSVSGYRDIAIAKNSPVDLPDGPMTWGVQEDLFAYGIEIQKPGAETPNVKELFRERGAKDLRELQRAGCVPTGYLGEFALNRLVENLPEDTAKDLADRYGLAACSLDEWEKKHVLRARYRSSESNRLFVAKVDNWTEWPTEQAVVVTRRLGLGNLPSDGVIEPLIGCWTRLAEQCASGKIGDEEQTIQIAVIDMDGGKSCEWVWRIKPSECAARLNAIANAYLSHLAGGLSDVTCKKYRKAAEKAGDQAIDLKMLSADEDEGRFGKKKKDAFDNSLVVEKVIDNWKTGETGPRFERLRDIWKWFVQGEKSARAPETDFENVEGGNG